ncbi:FAS1-like dehydratase domain-containing protein [Tsukamurella asaccharolytica]|uniref:FAS1-like dehydratase domain-containing protein n=1 Tax=Tsukamurella asaccharolytica TaxID=2592067 RepID=UPI001315431B|nr:MaoC family dehydratase N-terminal domain-containing protein [Tsukamurella asaccharolytica]
MSATKWEHWFPDTYSVSHDGVKAFARAVRSPHVDYASAGILADDCPVPGTLLAAPLLQKLATIISQVIPECNLSMVVHAAQEFAYVRPLRIGDTVSIGTTLVSHIQKAGTDLLTFEMGAFVGGELAVSASALIVHSRADLGGDSAAMDAAADAIMMVGTGPFESNDYSSALR